MALLSQGGPAFAHPLGASPGAAKVTKRIASALAIALDATGTSWREETTRVVLGELGHGAEEATLRGIRMAARECEYRLTLAAILERIPKQRPAERLSWPRYTEAQKLEARARLQFIRDKAGLSRKEGV